jgi:hypothetical protein
MLFNAEKCEVTHMGYNNKQTKCAVDWRNLEAIRDEHDWGVIVQ